MEELFEELCFFVLVVFLCSRNRGFAYWVLLPEL